MGSITGKARVHLYIGTEKVWTRSRERSFSGNFEGLFRAFTNPGNTHLSAEGLGESPKSVLEENSMIPSFPKNVLDGLTLVQKFWKYVDNEVLFPSADTK